jgi:glycosyltransferase involved in cell wall biosynthesis
MRVVHISTSDKGGAGTAAARLNSAMLRAGIESKILVLRSYRGGSMEMPRLDSRIFSQIRNFVNTALLGKVKKKFGFFTFALFGSSIAEHPAIIEADLIYIHWVHAGFLSLSQLSKIIKSGKPIIFFMHDMWFITGGCHHSFDCVKYRTQCVECPILEKKKLIDFAKLQFKIKDRIYKSNISFVAPSRWLTECAQKSFLSGDNKVEWIPNSLDTDFFCKVSRTSARRFLNLPENKRIICFGSDSGVENPYKGWKYLEEALLLLKEEDFELLIFGSDYDPIIARKFPFKINFTGKLSDEYSLKLIFNAIDLFVSPSLADNAPQTIIESMICGAPVVGFNIGGIPDMIEHKKSGYLAKYMDSVDLAKGIEYILHTTDYDNISENAIKMAKSLANENHVVNMHKIFWEKIMNSNNE